MSEYAVIESMEKTKKLMDYMIENNLIVEIIISIIGESNGQIKKLLFLHLILHVLLLLIFFL